MRAPTPITRLAAAAIALSCAITSCSDETQPPPAAATLDDPWALETTPTDPTLAAGREAFRFCASCHLADAGGRPDGTIPRLAGQRAPILEHKLERISTGAVDLPVMRPFARALRDEEIPAVAAYLASLPEPVRRERGSPADDDAAHRGAAPYAERCASCHGATGEGSDELRAPALCGQHAAYVERRLAEMRQAPRAGSDPAMLAVAAALPRDLDVALAEHLEALDCAASETEEPS